MDIIESLVATLKGSSDLISQLADGEGGVHSDLTAYSGRYPVICYQVINDVPHLWGDDVETARRVTVQISILTEDGADTDMVSIVNRLMLGLDWMRVSTDRVTAQDGIRITAMRYVIAEAVGDA